MPELQASGDLPAVDVLPGQAGSGDEGSAMLEIIHDVAPGDIVSIWPWLLHRHKKLWEDPDSFDPNRFTAEAKAGHHRFQYLPFGGWPRVCVGARFATTEALTILAHWLGRWHFSPSGRDVKVSGMVTLRPAGGLPLEVAAAD